MSKLERYARILVKRTDIPNLSASTAPSDDHTLLPIWDESDIYEGEFFMNLEDEKLWIRTKYGIKKVLFDTDINSGGTFVDHYVVSGSFDSGSGILTLDNQTSTPVIVSGFTTGGGGGGDIDFLPNAGLQYYDSTLSAQTIYNTLLDTSLTVPNDVGGISAGTTVDSLSGKSLVGIIDDLLFPTVSPTYTIPTLSINNVTETYEVGVTLSPSLTMTGRKNDAAAFTSLALIKNYNGGGESLLSSNIPVGTLTTAIPPQFGYSDPNNPNYNYALSYTDSGLIIPAPSSTSASSVIYGGSSVYGAGLPKQDNKGDYDARTPAVRSVNATQAASSTLTPSNRTLYGWYPYFYGISGTSVSFSDVVNIIQSGSDFTKVVATGSGTLDMTFNAVGHWPWFAIFSPFSTKTAWYVTPLNNGNIGTNPTDLFSAPTTLSVNSPDGYWSGINFKIYVAQKITTMGVCEIT